MSCWETLGLGIHVNVTLPHTTYLNIDAHQIHSSMAMVFLDGSGFQQDNEPCHTVGIVQEWFEEHDQEFKVLPWPLNSPDLNVNKHVRCAGKISLICGDPTSQLICC